jgi:hypothetical protein
MLESLCHHKYNYDHGSCIYDDMSEIVWQWDNGDPFGNNPPNENPNGVGQFSFDLRFPGQVYDRETDTHYNINRDYNPSIYTYVGGNPLSRIDPHGLWGIAFGNNSHSWSFNIGVGEPSYYISPSLFAPSQINGPVSGLANFMLGDGSPVPIGPDLLGALQELQKENPWTTTTCSSNHIGISDYGSWKHPYDDYLVEFSLGHFDYTNNGSITSVLDNYAFPVLSNGTGLSRYRNTLYSWIPGTPYRDFGSWNTPQ